VPDNWLKEVKVKEVEQIQFHSPDSKQFASTYIHTYIFHTAPSIFQAKNSTLLIAGGQQMRLRRGERECHIHKLWTQIEACGQTI